MCLFRPLNVWDFQALSQTFSRLRFSLEIEGKDGKNLNSQTWPGTPRRPSPRHPRPPESASSLAILNQVAHCSAPGDSVALRHPPVPRHLPSDNLKCDTPFKSWEGRCYRALLRGRSMSLLRHPPNTGKCSVTECSATVCRDGIAVAVEPLRFSIYLSYSKNPYLERRFGKGMSAENFKS